MSDVERLNAQCSSLAFTHYKYIDFGMTEEMWLSICTSFVDECREIINNVENETVEWKETCVIVWSRMVTSFFVTAYDKMMKQKL